MAIFIPISLFVGIFGLVISIAGLVQSFNREPEISRKGNKLLIAGIITLVVCTLVFFSTFWMSFRR